MAAIAILRRQYMRALGDLEQAGDDERYRERALLYNDILYTELFDKYKRIFQERTDFLSAPLNKIRFVRRIQMKNRLIEIMNDLDSLAEEAQGLMLKNLRDGI
jgi:hypothetical protein